MVSNKKTGYPSIVSVAYTITVILTVLSPKGTYGKPILEDSAYMNTEEIMNQWDNDDGYYDDVMDKSGDIETSSENYLPPMLVQQIPSTTSKPVYFPRTDIELSPLMNQLAKARRNELAEPVDLPVPVIVWTKDNSGHEDSLNYWQRFYNTMYKVD